MAFCSCWSLYFLLCMICLRPCSGETNCETSDHMSLLQVSTQLQRSPSFPDNAGVTDPKNFILFSQHKAGYVMSGEAANEMQSAANQSGLSLKFANNLDMAWALTSSEMHSQPACFLHVVRNPFEMLVSGYLYHMATSESWLTTTFDKAETLLKNNSVLQLQQQLGHGVVQPLQGVVQLFHSLRSGSISATLPEAKANETYPDYLKRVDLSSGLIAEFIWASNSSLASLLFTDSFLAESRPCSVTMCQNEFRKDCNGTWQGVFQAWQLQDDGVLLAAATRSCPGVSKGEEGHSSDDKAKNITHLPDHEMVKRLRELDRTLLGGRIAALEKHNNCPLSGKYL